MEFSEEADKVETQPSLRLATGGSRGRHQPAASQPVMAGLVPAIHVFAETGTALARSDARRLGLHRDECA